MRSSKKMLEVKSFTLDSYRDESSMLFFFFFCLIAHFIEKKKGEIKRTLIHFLLMMMDRFYSGQLEEIAAYVILHKHTLVQFERSWEKM